jgi:hypothetical protein
VVGFFLFLRRSGKEWAVRRAHILPNPVHLDFARITIRPAEPIA